jgi:hypothetical protein
MVTGTLERLEDRLADLCGHRNVLDAQLVRIVAEALETGEWEMHQFLHIHHVIHWDPDHGAGPTDTFNLACLCPLGERLQMHWVTFNPPHPPAPRDDN